MAYRSKSRRSGARRSARPVRRSSGRRNGYSARRAPSRGVSRGASRGQTVRIVLEQAGSNPTLMAPIGKMFDAAPPRKARM